MRDARFGERLQRSVEGHWIRGGQRAVDRDRPRDDADRAERRQFPADRRPDLADERGDRGLAAGAGDRDDRLGLARIKPGRSPRQGQARVDDMHERCAFGRRPSLGDDRARPALKRVRNVSQSVVPRPGEREEDVAGLDLAAVEGHAGHGPTRERRVRRRQFHDVAEPSHAVASTPCRSCRRRLHSPSGR